MCDMRSQFQSRNRESFDFKTRQIRGHGATLLCFNLVIENLLISSPTSMDE